MPEEFVEYKVKDGDVSIILHGGWSGTHSKSLVAIIGELAEWGCIGERELIEIESKTKAIRNNFYKGE